MADDVTFQSVTPATPPDATVVAATDIAGRKYQKIILADGSGTILLPLTDAQLRASAVPVSFSGVVHVDDNAGSLTVDGTVAVSNFPATQPVSGPLTDAQLRATPVPVSGTVSVNQPVAVTDNGGSLTVDGSVQVQGVDAADAPVSGFPVLSGGRASNAIPGPVSADGDAVSVWLDRRGATHAIPTDANGAVYVPPVQHAMGEISSGYEGLDTGTLALSIRQDTATGLTNQDGDFQALSTDKYGRLHINIPTVVVNGQPQVLVFDSGVRQQLKEANLILRDIRTLLADTKR